MTTKKKVKILKNIIRLLDNRTYLFICHCYCSEMGIDHSISFDYTSNSIIRNIPELYKRFIIDSDGRWNEHRTVVYPLYINQYDSRIEAIRKVIKEIEEND